MDRAFGYGPKGWGFESSWAHHCASPSRRRAAAFLLAACFLTAPSRILAEPTLVLREDLVIGLDEEHALGAPSDCAVDSRGNILIADPGFDTVARFREDGSFLDTVGRVGEGPGEYGEPLRVAVGPGDRIYVAWSGTRIVVLEPDGAPADFEIRRESGGSVHALAVAADGTVYVVSYDGLTRTMIHAYAGDTHELVASFCASYAVGRDLPPHLEGPLALGSLDLAPDGSLFYVQSAPQLVRVFDPAGALRAEHRARYDDAPRLPEPEIQGDTVTFRTETWSPGILALGAGRFLTGLARWHGRDIEQTLDLYAADGTRIASRGLDRGLSLRETDPQGRIYVTEVRDDLAVLVRYALAISGE